MIWLTWRQFRAQGTVVFAALGAVAVIVALTAGQVADISQTNFFDLFKADRTNTAVFNLGLIAVLVLPAVVGVFWGAPLIARELEMGTHRLAWNQTVTRTGWLATKLALIGLAAMAGAGLLSLVVTWWSGPIDDAIAAGGQNPDVYGRGRLEPPLFGARGIVPIGYTAFAFAFGVTCGAVIRRTVPAMAITLAVFVAVQIAVPSLVRQHIGATQVTSTITAQNLTGLLAEGPEGPVRELRIELDEPGAWLIANQTVDARGERVSTLPSWVMGCVPKRLAGKVPETDTGCFARLTEAGYRQHVTYQAANRFWTLQAIETAIFLALAGLLTAFCFWWIRHRVS